MGSSSLADLVDVEEGVLSPRVFVDEDLYRRELDRVFGRQWLFVAHESEVPSPGDFVTRSMGEDPVIVARGPDGVVRVLLNACRHRGRRVCSEDSGRAAQLMCPYHGWTYSTTGELVGVPFFDAYQGRLDRAGLGLHAAPRVETYHSLIFASWEPGGISLHDYLGPMAWVLDLLFGRTPSMEVVGPPLRWVADANWKLAAANFAGDGHHIFTTHGFRNALLLETLGGNRTSYVLPTDQGHAATLTCWPPDVAAPPNLALPDALMPEVKAQLSPDQLGLLESLMLIVGNVFPNLSFLDTASHTPAEWGGGPDAPPMSFLTLRQWQPRGATRMEIWSWLLVDADAPTEWKEASRQCYLREFGPGGVFEQDDLANWVTITETLRTPIAQRLRLQYRMGMEVQRATDWPGPGVAYLKRSFEELNERVFYRRWHELVAD